MRDVPSIVTSNVPNSGPPLPQIMPYQLFQRQSHKLGAVAIRRFDELKTLMNQEVTLPSADQLLENIRQQKVKIMEESLRRVQELKASVARSHEVLAGVQTIALFPDEVIVDRTKVTIIKRRGFWSTDVISIQIEDVLNVSSTVGLLFGSLTVASRVMSTTDHYDVHMLWRQDAIDLKHIIQGYTIAKHGGFDMNDLPREAVLETIRELGHDSGKTSVK